MTEKTFKISGIHCAACSSILEKFMSRQEGVLSVSVNLTTEKWTSSMTIGSTPTKYASSSRALVSVLRSISLPMRSRRSVAKGRSRRSSRSSTALKSASYCALFFALPLLYVSMGHMAGLPLPSFMSPHHAPLTFALVQLALTLPIVIGGRGFYINGFGSLVKGLPNMDTLVAVGTFSALLYGIYAAIKIALGDMSYAENLFFESAAVVITLVMLGKYLEARRSGTPRMQYARSRSSRPRRRWSRATVRPARSPYRSCVWAML